jgi:hypothetical protein
MKTLRCRHYSFKEVEQFTVENKVLDPSASNIPTSLARDVVP